MKQVLLVNGVPASGKSTVTRLLVRGLVAQGGGGGADVP